MATGEPLRMGILGAAKIYERVVVGARQTDAVDFRAVGTRDAAKGAAFAERHGVPTVRDSYEALLSDPEIEAVYIPVPNSLHHPWTMTALEAGKHVLCEKPYSNDPAEVEQAFDLAERKGLVLAEAFMWRHGPPARRIPELVAEAGEVVTIRAAFSFVLDWTTDVRLDADLDGGALMDVGCYCVSGSRLVAGEEPVRVSAVAKWGPTGVDRRLHGTLEFPNGAVAQISCGFDTDYRGLEVSGTRGWFRIEDPWQQLDTRFGVNGEASSYEAVNPYKLELENFADAVRGRQAPLLGRADALGQARTIQALYRSAREGAPVRL